MTTEDDADEDFLVEAVVDVPMDRRFHLKLESDIKWLEDADVDAAIERLTRLEGDRDLIADLRVDGFAGKEYDVFQGELARYGYAVILGWIFRGAILQKVKERSFGALPPEPRTGALQEDAESLAGETVATALKGFRDEVLVPGRWDGSKGATLRTYFVGQCLMRFSNIYRVWYREQSKRGFPVDWDLLEANRPGITTSSLEPGSVVAIRKAEIMAVLGEITDERTRAIFWHVAIAGRSHEEIGKLYDMSAKAVENAIGRARRALKKKGMKNG